jgi:hypothetical protein
MTWVISLNGRGHISMVTDIQVTWRDPVKSQRQYADVLRKSYVLTPQIVLGFAGSVALGFRSIDLAQELLVDNRLSTQPDQFTDALQTSLAKNVSSEDLTKCGGLAVLVAGICSPDPEDKDCIGQAFVAKLEHSNGFGLQICPVMGAIGIGSGQHIYREHFNLLNDRRFLWQSQEDGFPLPAIKFAYCTYRTLANQPESSVSRHMHFSFLSWHDSGPEVRHYSLDPPLWLKDAPDHILEIMKLHWHVKKTGGFGTDLMPQTASSLLELETLLKPYAYDDTCRMTLTTDPPIAQVAS